MSCDVTLLALMVAIRVMAGAVIISSIIDKINCESFSVIFYIVGKFMRLNSIDFVFK